MARSQLNKRALLERLPRIEYTKPENRDGERFDQVSLSGALLMLAEISHESEFGLCRSVAEHLLNEVPEPDDTVLSDE